MLRKHIKVEPARYYHDADRLGMLIWQDMPSGGGEDQYLAGTSQYQAIFPSETLAEQQKQLSEMVGELRAFPSIVTWVINNEGWGHYDSRSEEHTSELQSLMRISSAVFCFKQKTK